MKHYLAAGLTAALTLGAAGMAAAQDLRLLTGWDDRSEIVTQILDPFMEVLKDATDGAITITRAGPETIPPFEQLDPVGRGVFDMLFTNGAYHYNDTAVAMAVEALQVTPETLHSSGVWDFVDEHYRQFGLKLVAYLIDENGYNLILKEPLDDSGLEGRRIRGTPVYHPVIELLGGSPVVLPASEIYPALERGVVDGAAWPLVGAYGFRWFEVADYLMRPSFGRVGYPIFMSLDRWESLDDATRTAILDAGTEFERTAHERFDRIVEVEETALAEESMEIITLPEGLVTDLPTAWFEGVMALAEQQDAGSIGALRTLGADAGLTP